MEEIKTMTVQNATQTIEMVKCQVAQMGNNDFEIPALTALIEKVEAGEIDPEKAVEEAYGIMNSKVER
jgi:hypothetical protein